eukprot:CAMPEP_0195064110 /NCGR_PEP_ID=MMETSP0448-20130528/10305_1 /TAXON_ID=66468 /ORGANISM="Heterocapsa triquestra, Strain CCMP 448" /LENGTH=84 /DNA_ID=CAMNT_0040095105 /DNA_START=385 /DNA_END=637 /DNA_ORIENTATION=-
MGWPTARPLEVRSLGPNCFKALDPTRDLRLKERGVRAVFLARAPGSCPVRAAAGKAGLEEALDISAGRLGQAGRSPGSEAAQSC